MNEGGFTFMRVRGIPIRANFSFLILIFIFLLPALRAEDRGTALIVGLITGLLYFGSILLHELGHAFQALREKLEIDGITLWALGGLAHIATPITSPWVDFRVSVAGPAVTAVLAGVFRVLATVGEGAGLGSAPAQILESLAFTQLVLLIFNLIPAYPLDGGRMLRAWLWHRRDNMTSASKTASSWGRAFGVALMVLGGVSMLVPFMSMIIPGFRISGIFTVLIGYFIYSGARESITPAVPLRRSTGLIAGDFMTPNFIIAEPDMTIAALLDALGRLQLRPTALVLSDGQPVGMVTRQLAEGIPEDERGRRKVADVMTPKDQIRVVDFEDTLATARTALESGPETAVVLHNDVVVGLLSVSDVARAMVAGSG